MNLTALKIAVAVPYFSVWLLLLIPLLFGIYSIWKYRKLLTKARAQQEQKRKDLNQKKQTFAATAQPLKIDDYSDFLTNSIDKPNEAKKSLHKRIKKKKLNKRKNRSRAAKKSRKSNRK